MRRVKVFTDRYPYLGPLVWIVTVEYFIIQVIVALAWRQPSYSWRFNAISDLGNTVCRPMSGRMVCSPLHTLMNLSFICLGGLMAGGALFIYQEFREKLSTRIGFSLMALAGFGTVLVGIFPENTVRIMHFVGALLPFLIGNVSLIILSFALYGVNNWLKIYTFLSGLIALAGLPFFLTHHYLGLGLGGLERLVAYPQTIWLIIFGLYISRSHYLRRRRVAKP